jgi:acylphosphatase
MRGRDLGRAVTDDERVRLTAWVRGRVQGVGFRWWVRSRALELGLEGSATNLSDGRVEVVAEGPRTACERLLDALRGPGTPGRVSGVAERWSPARGGVDGFVER